MHCKQQWGSPLGNPDHKIAAGEVSARGLQSFGRRRLLKMLAAAAAALPLMRVSAQAEGSRTTRGGAWVLGDNLSLAALLYSQGAPQAMIDQTLGKAQSISKAMGIEIPPFPSRSAKQAATDADVIHYLIQGDGARVGTALAKKYDDEHGTLFEVSVKSNLLIRVYAPDDSLGKTIADVIKTRCEAIGLPSKLWMNVVTSVRNRRPVDEVKNAVFDMHKNVANYYLSDT